MVSENGRAGAQGAAMDAATGAGGDTADRRMIGALLRIPREATLRRVLDGLAAAGFADVRPAHFTVFQHMPPEGIRLTVLADAALLTKQSTAYLVDDLEVMGYLERVPDPSDRRAKVLRLTARGRAVEDTVRATIRQIEADWAQRLGEANYQELTRLLRALVAMLEA
jgi:DNA-binding MarR family transcriptional regulator